MREAARIFGDALKTIDYEVTKDNLLRFRLGEDYPRKICSGRFYMPSAIVQHLVTVASRGKGFLAHRVTLTYSLEMREDGYVYAIPLPTQH